MDLSGITPAQQKELGIVTNNLELLRLAFNILQQLVAEKQKKRAAQEICDAFTLSAASRIVYQRHQEEKLKLPRIASGAHLSSDEFMHVPFSIPEDKKNEIAKEIHKSAWFQTVYPNWVEQRKRYAK